jgi:hypothetical protein
VTERHMWVSPIDRHHHWGDAGRAECAVCCLEAERDRLRAVVDAVRAFRPRLCPPHGRDDRTVVVDLWDPTWRAVVDALDQLDASPEATNG